MSSNLYRTVATAGLTALLVVTLAGPAAAIPPPELLRIGSVFVQALAVAVVSLSAVLFFLRRQLGRAFAALKSGRKAAIAAVALVVVVVAWAASAVYVKQANRRLLAAAPPAAKSATVTDGVMTVAGMQFDIADPSLAIAPREAAKLIGATNHALIDIREPVEFATRHVEGFVNLRAGDLLAGEEYRKIARDKTIVLLCEAGERGSAIAAFLRLRGYQASFIDKGMRGWIDAALPFAGSADMKLPDFPNKYAKLSAAEARVRLNGKRAVLIDVRSPAEFARGHVAGAVNLPLVNLPTADLEAALAKLPQDQEVIGIAYDRFGAYYCLIVGWLIDQRRMTYGGTLMMPPPEQTL
jgi:rhodanese-related sulfurtransferase